MPPLLIACRLCLQTCKNSNNLYCENGLGTTELYATVHKYFHPKIVDLEKAKHLTTICVKCSRHICDFQRFETSVTLAQLHLVGHDQEVTVKTEKVEVDLFTTSVSTNPQAHTSSTSAEGMQNEMNPDNFYFQVDYNSGYGEIGEAIVTETQHITEPKLELIDIHPDSEFSSGDETPLVDFVKAESETGAADFQMHTELPSGSSSKPDYDELKKRFKCNRCDNSYTGRGSLMRHKERQHAERDNISHKLEFYFQNATKLFKCKLCGEGYKRRNAIVMHFTRQECKVLKLNNAASSKDDDEITKRLKCKLCDTTFTERTSLKRHNELQHAERDNDSQKFQFYFDEATKMFKCKLCGQAYTGRNAIVMHFTRQECKALKINNDSFECEHCHKVFGSHKSLDLHHRSCLPDASEYPCRKCGQNFESYELFRKHKCYHQRAQPKHTCSKCGKCFKNPSQLRHHMLSHTKEASFACLYCPVVFKQYRTLVQHKKRVHAQEETDNKQGNVNAVPAGILAAGGGAMMSEESIEHFAISILPPGDAMMSDESNEHC